MPKRIFWPAALVTMGLIVIASIMGYLPRQFTMFWPIVLIVVGLGGLLTADREDWIVFSNSKSAVKATKSVSARRTTTSRKKSSRR